MKQNELEQALCVDLSALISAFTIELANLAEKYGQDILELSQFACSAFKDVVDDHRYEKTLKKAAARAREIKEGEEGGR